MVPTLLWDVGNVHTTKSTQIMIALKNWTGDVDDQHSDLGDLVDAGYWLCFYLWFCIVGLRLDE